MATTRGCDQPADAPARRDLLRALPGMALAAGGLPLRPAAAQEATLTIGVQQEATTLDPHFYYNAPNIQVASHIFDALTRLDEQQRPGPGLAESWRTIDDTTWEFRLREGVTFHDGTPLTIEDIVFSFQRPATILNSPGGFTRYASGKTLTAIDARTLRIRTERPDPLLLGDLAMVSIVSRRHVPGPDSAPFNSGEAAIGTGPFRYGAFIPGDRIELLANPAYWGGAPPWQKVVFRLLRSDASRVATLLAGQADVIGHVPTADVPRLRGMETMRVVQVPSDYVVFLSIDSSRDLTPFVRDTQGQPLYPNPLRDQRVRQAMSLAINRAAIVERVMEGMATPAGQLAQEGNVGFDPALRPAPFDADQARALLRSAGYPNGFQLTLHSPNDRYVNDARIAQAVAQMLTRIGIQTSVEAQTRNVFFARATNGGENGTPAFSVYLTALFSSGGEALPLVRAALGSYEASTGAGSNNRGRYSNVRLDALLNMALRTVDPARRNALMREAQQVAMRDVALIPLHYQANTWAMRAGLTMAGRSDERIDAARIRRA